MTHGRRPVLESAFATFVFFTAFAGQFWRNLLGWWGFGAVVAVVLIGSVWLWVARRPRLSWRRTPKSTLFLLGIATLSLAWSHYPGGTALGLAILFVTTIAALSLTLSLGWHGVLRAVGGALKWVLALSLLFEFWVAVFVREPLLPNFPDFDASSGDLPMAFYWSRAMLFDGGPIEGIVGSRNLLGMAALIAAILFAALLASGGMRRAQGIGWLVVSGTVLLLTRSATVALVGALVLAAFGFAMWARRVGPERRRTVYVTAAAALAASVALAWLLWSALLDLFGKSDDLTGRLDIWESVIGLAAERPVVGWGYIGYWQPWVEPFDGLAVRNGVEYLQAHNAWLDVWMQLGVVGLLAFAAMVVGALWRSWFLAVDQPRDDRGHPVAFSAIALVPLLVLVALIGQSLAESRLLIESGWILLLAITWGTKQRQWSPEPLPTMPPTRSPRRWSRPEVPR
ncbi:O-antigen ligase family protein [Agromyces binzhouensis]|uniref:O-antigen ligase family protein n=1 Tax=Agromyces binzhouensis TaxID=1817495 RepID=A0A4Q2JPW3_9MICO|nr:O-antigen ligase family protein [Agromyces binzhouensis]RXZ48280.1 O-antigen ligase family protein [Agromyces binzhouensis]